jgi:hypothetical protein
MQRKAVPTHAKGVHIILTSIITLLIGTAAVAQKSRFDPPFRNEVHAPRAEDAGIVQALQISEKDLGDPNRFALVHGHFLDSGTDAAVVTAFRPASRGESPTTFVLSKDETGWRVRHRNESFLAAYCRVVPVSALKDLLLCQSNYVGLTGDYGNGPVSSSLYTLNFTPQPEDSWFLTIKDTVKAGSRCLVWANLKSVEFRGKSLHVLVEYGRNRLPADGKTVEEFGGRARGAHGNPAAFPHELYDIEFKLDAEGFYPAAASKNDFDYVTAPWDREGTCSVSPGRDR